jgi:hypothetical protein
MIAEAVYILCSIFSSICAVMLFRGFLASRQGLLFWSGLCFVGLALTNILLVIDLLVVPHIDLSLTRAVIALASVLVLVIGMVWETT